MSVYVTVDRVIFPLTSWLNVDTGQRDQQGNERTKRQEAGVCSQKSCNNKTIADVEVYDVTCFR